MILFLATFHTVCVQPKSIPQPTLSTKETETRPESNAFLSIPEWDIVWTSQEYADWIKKNRPSDYPFVGAIKEFWGGYCVAYGYTQSRYPFDVGEHISKLVIGVSYTAENSIKGLYENTLGRVTEFLGTYPATPEDVFAAAASQRYALFILLRPFYEFSYGSELVHFWKETSWFGPHFVRKWERKFAFTTEYGIKTIYGWIITLGTHASFGVAGDTTQATISYPTGTVTVNLPRYQPFLAAAQTVAENGGTFLTIAGNDDITLSVIAPATWQPPKEAITLATQHLTTTDQSRFLLIVPVANLSAVLLDLEAQHRPIEHLYDF